MNENTYRGEGRFIHRSGGPGQYGHCVLEVEATGLGSGFVFESAVTGGAIPQAYLPGILAGVKEAMQPGILAGYPVIDVKVTVVDGSFHEVDSNPHAFRMAGMLAFRDACRKAPMVILEPVAELMVTLPRDYVGTVMADISRRRGQLQNMDGGKEMTIQALIPIAETFGYATDLRGLTQGRATFTLTPTAYAEVPESIQSRLVGQQPN